ncbi:ABC transporter ATP-binding protein [Naumannella sp. ID2617S]|nr:ABC transporter ATP-binding protein [Naumannella sp. ID2617S]
MDIVEVRDLCKSYAGRPVVNGVDLSVAEGEIFGILGPNGAGKTTTVEMIGGLRTRDRGQVKVAGFDPAMGDRGLRELLGMQLQESRQPAKITVREAIELYRTFYRAPRDTGELLTRFGLMSRADTRFEQLSGGQQQRLSVALALVGNPRVAILDELTTGLDPAARHEIWDFLSDLAADGVTIVLVTHSMEEAQHLCDRVAIIDGGRVRALDTPARLAHSRSDSIISFTTHQADRVHGLRELLSVVELVVAGSEVTVRSTASGPAEVLAHLTGSGIPFEALRISAPSLDDAYLALTRKESR